MEKFRGKSHCREIYPLFPKVFVSKSASLAVMFSKYNAEKVFPNQHRDSELPRRKMTVPSIKSREVSKLRMQSVVAKAKRRLSITQGCFYSAFLVVLGVLSYGNRDSARYVLSKSLDDHIGNFEKVSLKERIF